MIVILPLFNIITSNINTTTVTTITTVPRVMNVKLVHALYMHIVKSVKQQNLRNSLLCEVETNRACCEGC